MSDMSRLCSRDPEQPTISKPFAVQYDGKTWCCATDGHCLLVRSDLPAEVVSEAPAAHKVLAEASGPGTPSTVAHLRAGFGAPASRLPWFTCVRGSAPHSGEIPVLVAGRP